MTKELLNTLFKYNNGKLYWMVKGRSKGKLKNQFEAGTVNKGYKWLITEHLPQRLSVHRAIWIMHHGDIPEGMLVDHINRDPLDNRIENLRLATYAENAQNTLGKKSKNNDLPVNVYKDKGWINELRYRAQVVVNGKTFYEGGFKTVDEAKEAATRLRKKKNKFEPDLEAA